LKFHTVLWGTPQLRALNETGVGKNDVTLEILTAHISMQFSLSASSE